MAQDTEQVQEPAIRDGSMDEEEVQELAEEVREPAVCDGNMDEEEVQELTGEVQEPAVCDGGINEDEEQESEQFGVEREGEETEEAESQDSMW